MQTRVTQILNIRTPVIQAGMAGQATTPQLVAAVSDAGGLGTLGAGYMSPQSIREAVRRIRTLTDRPFAVNLLIPGRPQCGDEEIGEAQKRLTPFRKELGIEAAPVGSLAPDFDAQLAVVLEERVPVFSFTFDLLPRETIRRLRENGTVVIGTATTVREGLALEEAGVDLIVGQGSEAGGHRGSFLGDADRSMVGTMALIPQLADAVEVPVIAAGGIMDGRGLAAALALGAEGAQLGTAFLTAAESVVHPCYRQAVLDATEEETAVTRAFSGKEARGIRNRFMETMAGAPVPPYPVQNALTRDIRSAAARQNRPEYFSLWAGQGLRMSRERRAGEIVDRTGKEAEEIFRRMREENETI